MDHLDIRILEVLQQDGTLTKAELAECVASTPSTCLRRVQRLVDAGYLDRCVYLANPKKLERGIRAFITVVSKDHGGQKTEGFIDRLAQEPSITLAYGTTGEVDAVVQGYFADLEEYQAVCARLFDADPDVERYTTFFGVQSFKDTTEIPADALARRLKGT